MSFLKQAQTRELSRFAVMADREVRSDLALGLISDERDYTSHFVGALRRNINVYSRSGLEATSFSLRGSEERETGADAAIILSRGAESKIAVFEAKWPRFSIPGYSWDYEQTASGLSHFSDQLERQKKNDGRFAIFEMFYCEFPFGGQPGYMQDKQSSCVWHSEAELFRSSRASPNAVWTQGDLIKLLSANRMDVGHVMAEFGICIKGRPMRFALPSGVNALTAREMIPFELQIILPGNVLGITARPREISKESKPD